MSKKLTILATAAAVLLSTASATFAAPKTQHIPEPLYFKYATGEQG
jgi:hypothetical protein